MGLLWNVEGPSFGAACPLMLISYMRGYPTPITASGTGPLRGTAALQSFLITDDPSVMKSRDVRPRGLALASRLLEANILLPRLEGPGVGFDYPGLGLEGLASSSRPWPSRQ